MITIYNEDCLQTVQKLPTGSVNVVLTSPPYNTSRYEDNKSTLSDRDSGNAKVFPSDRYDEYNDRISNDEYIEFTLSLFRGIDRILAKNGVVLYNISYGGENSECMFRTISAIIERTPFTIADMIVWKKGNAVPNNVSPNRLTRICEYVYVFCRRDEIKTFQCNKGIVSVSKIGQNIYQNIFNFIEAKNNDGVCPYNASTYSTELCFKLLNIYAKDDSVVYDPFMGSGTTAVACKILGLDCYGSEISKRQCEYANDWLSGVGGKKKLW